MSSFSRWLWLLVWLGLGTCSVLTVWLAFLGLTYPYQLDYGEGIVLWFTRELARGHSIYNLPGFPYASSNYPPVSMLVSTALMPIFGDGYMAGRLLNFASALLVAALIFRIVRTETRDRSAGAIAALLFIGSPYVYHWIPLFRADMIGLALAVGAVYCVWEWQRLSDAKMNKAEGRGLDWIKTRGLLPAAFLLCLLALYTKQTLVSAPTAAFMAILARDRRTALTFALALGVVGGAIYASMDAVTGGGFTFGLITSNATLFVPAQLVTLLQNFLATFPILILLAVLGWLRRVRARQITVLEWYAVASFAVLGLAGRVGAWENYFFEAIAATCVFLGFEFSDFRSQISDSAFPIPQSFASTLQPLTFKLILPVLLLAQLAFMWHDPRIAAELVARDLPANQQLAALLARTPGTVISEDMGALVTSGKPVVYYTFQYASLASSGKWDQHWELDGLRGGEFPLVILEQGTREDVDHYKRFTRDFVSTLDEFYARTQTIGKFEVYTPSLLTHFQHADFGNDLAMLGWSVDRDASTRELNVTIVWQARHASMRRFKSFVQLVKADGSKVAQDDHEPRDGVYPTTRWAAGEMVRENYLLKLPDDAVLGTYTMKVGWYEADTGDRLPVAESSDNSVTLDLSGTD